MLCTNNNGLAKLCIYNKPVASRITNQRQKLLIGMALGHIDQLYTRVNLKLKGFKRISGDIKEKGLALSDELNYNAKV